MSNIIDIDLYNALDIMSAEKVVREHVLKNHDNNLWWPNTIDDYKIRLLVAGLSTRVSYNMIQKYISVVDSFSSYKYDEIRKMADDDLLKIISVLGLATARISYIRSMIDFIDTYPVEIQNCASDELIELISRKVKGASYKVAQCCVLYMKGYYCGIMPVDSGMKDLLLPCIGFCIKRGSIGHEAARRDLEEIVKALDLRPLINKNGYSDLLTVPPGRPLTWWAHLVLIYFKRAFCNKHKPELCPLYINHLKIKCSCKK
ncbi:MAG: hypothetical protein WCP79_00195 [Bacillota bacterium]